MYRLAMLLFLVIGASMAGILIVAVLVAGMDTKTPILVAAILGFALAVPVSWIVAQRLS
ncbi:CTP synthetase [Tropicimonas sp. IMCC34043]|uniref:CTP synthetase n=1 Tax=Tropicimonas sp. IMCC34043 TaxID=2248760 RepID=UPI000E22072B|nr:CTP synthetase [Tropicimonas sp. IMCC34043]